LGGVAGGTTRFAIGTSDPVTLGVFRFGVGFLLLLPIALALRIKWPRGRDWFAVAALGVMYFAFFIVLFNLAFRYTTAARGLVALLPLPLMTMLVGAALGVEALDRRKASAWSSPWPGPRSPSSAALRTRPPELGAAT